jgi:glycosyltransferase involved in cell wall biosynthesis
VRIALIAPPFITVPPQMYGGTELFIAHLALGLKEKGFEIVVYTNGESTVEVEKRWLYQTPQWPIEGHVYDNLKDFNHTAWSIADAAPSCDVIHLNNLPGLPCSRLVGTRFVYTIHHPHVPALSSFYRYYPGVDYVTISDFQRSKESMPRMRTIHHGIDTSVYRSPNSSRKYLSFLGRIAPIKGTHLAIQAAKKSGVPLKIAGEVQPMYQEYFDREIKPHLDGNFIEYIGEVGLEGKNELLGNSLALLFPIQWDEPFGLVMVEAMACGAPVLAMPGGSVPEIVREGVSGYVCKSIDEMVARIRNLDLAPGMVREYVEQNFSVGLMVSRYANLYQQIAGEGAKKKESKVPPRAAA